jgi:hypothetical protein
MAETMMLALEHRYQHTSLGRDLQEETLNDLRGYATKHGFTLAELRSKGRPLNVSAWQSQFSGGFASGSVAARHEASRYEAFRDSVSSTRRRLRMGVAS